jgi:hypothetical protein
MAESHMHEQHRIDETMTYIGWGGTLRTVRCDMDLGIGVMRHDLSKPSIGSVMFDIAYGYVSGFRKRDILYYVVTRSLSRRLCKWAVAREQRGSGPKYSGGTMAIRHEGMEPWDAAYDTMNRRD